MDLIICRKIVVVPQPAVYHTILDTHTPNQRKKEKGKKKNNSLPFSSKGSSSVCGLLGALLERGDGGNTKLGTRSQAVKDNFCILPKHSELSISRAVLPLPKTV